MTMTMNQPLLYAEDDENDLFLTQRAFNLAQVTNPLHVVADGQAAIDYLAAAAARSSAEAQAMPCLILLDLKMPGKNGFDVLKWVRAEPVVRMLPVLILTSSSQESDVERAYSLGANGYLIKPGTPSELLLLVRSIKDFWLTQNRICPPRTQRS